jgi:hypothetical protein
VAKRRTPHELAEVIMHRHAEVIAHAEEKIRVKRTVPLENQAEHVRNASEEEIVAFVEGYSACLETVMHAFNCYAGFHHYGPQKPAEPIPVTGSPIMVRRQTTQGQPDYQPWRRLYYTNGITKK